jgi:hypothetical protein
MHELQEPSPTGSTRDWRCKASPRSPRPPHTEQPPVPPDGTIGGDENPFCRGTTERPSSEQLGKHSLAWQLVYRYEPHSSSFADCHQNIRSQCCGCVDHWRSLTRHPGRRTGKWERACAEQLFDSSRVVEACGMLRALEQEAEVYAPRQGCGSGRWKVVRPRPAVPAKAPRCRKADDAPVILD